MPETVGLIGNHYWILGGVSPNFQSFHSSSATFVGGFGRSTEKQYDFAGDIPGQQQDRSLECGGRGFGSESGSGDW